MRAFFSFKRLFSIFNSCNSPFRLSFWNRKQENKFQINKIQMRWFCRTTTEIKTTKQDLLDFHLTSHLSNSLWVGFPHGSSVKNLPVNADDVGLIPGSGRSPGEGNGNPLHYSCLEKSHGQRRLVGYSLWDHKKSDRTEQLSTQVQDSRRSDFQWTLSLITCLLYTLASKWHIHRCHDNSEAQFLEISTPSLK